VSNPLIDQGVLNRLRGSVVFSGFPSLQITAPYLGKAGIRLALEGESVLFIPTMTGAVTSPEPYLMVSLSMNLIKTQPLADAFKKQMESNSLLGPATVRPDSSALSPYDLINTAIESVRELNFSGVDADYLVVIKGYYSVNSSLFA
jgi:hypothetical protein